METVNIRDIRGNALRERARNGLPLAIANHRVLIGVFIPVAAEWVEHLIEHNWSQVRQSISEGEQAMAAGTPMTTLDEVTLGADGSGGQRRIPLLAAIVGRTMKTDSRSQAIIDGLRAALAPPDSRPDAVGEALEPRMVRIGDLTAGVIEQAGEEGRIVAITHQRELVGIVIPITSDLVQFLIEQNLSRVLYSIRQGEKELGTADRLISLDQLLDPDTKAAEL